METNKIVIYAYGYPSVNYNSPKEKRGGYAIMMVKMPFVKELIGGMLSKSIEEIQLTAIVKALELLKKPSDIELFIPHKEIANIINNNIIERWYENDWRDQYNKKIKHVKLWAKIYENTGIHNIKVYTTSIKPDKIIVDYLWAMASWTIWGEVEILYEVKHKQTIATVQRLHEERMGA